MAKLQPHKTANIRFGERLSEAFEQFKEQVRERAYYLSQARDPDQGNPMDDWLEAQAQLSEIAHLEVKDQKKNTVVEVTLKDFAPEEIEIEVAGNLLQIFGYHSDTTRQKESDGGGSTSKTRCFFQSVALNAPVDMEHSHAKLLKNGKLKVVLPKKMAGKTKVD
jgi:HSP20 family molecular chaperone IbpA